MKIELFEPYLLGEKGFFRYLYLALKTHKKAKLVSEPRPLPKVIRPREHTSAWTRFDGHLVFFDFSDHVFLYDTDALKMCDVYFKANLHRGVTHKVLERVGLTQHDSKILPFIWFAGNLDAYRPDSLKNRFLFHGVKPTVDVCHIVGVYDNYLAKGERSVFQTNGEAIEPGNYHFWIRYHVQQALKEAGISGHYRLTSRGNRQIEDNTAIFPNLSERQFMRAMLSSRFTMINTLPHAVLPWKASESLMLGRPIIVERVPVVETPEPFRLRPGEHCLELLPDFGGFDEAADIDDPRSYRILNPLRLDELKRGVERIALVIRDRDKVRFMAEKAKEYAETALSPGFISDFICDQVRARIH
jgi:hypothetical protein